ncbi:hypothetical protein IG631_24128 [Alternaria alternata]|nr:hypothetical protein IG631_24128 [Alternaria alternata]
MDPPATISCVVLYLPSRVNSSAPIRAHQRSTHDTMLFRNLQSEKLSLKIRATQFQDAFIAFIVALSYSREGKGELGMKSRSCVLCARTWYTCQTTD